MFTQAKHRLKPEQIEVIHSSLESKVFLEGQAGAGKTTAGVERMLHLMARGVPGNEILVLLPQRTLAGPYRSALQHPGTVAGGMVSLLTVGGLAQRMIDLFWPILAGEAGFGQPDHPPIFLTLETAQYYLAHLVKSMLAEGYFNSISIDRNRLYSQILDNMNKAAIVGFSHTEIAERLKNAWVGEPGQFRVYDDVQESINLFREHCYRYNLLDFSLQMELFRDYLWNASICRDYLRQKFRHLIFDNIEEDPPFSVDLLQSWIPEYDSVLVIYDWLGGYRRFLGADPGLAYSLKSMCKENYQFEHSIILDKSILHLQSGLAKALRPMLPDWIAPMNEPDGVFIQAQSSQNKLQSNLINQAMHFEPHRFYSQMLDWVVEKVVQEIDENRIPASEIVILAPYLSDALRFSLMSRLEQRGVPVRSHRPSRALRDEPAVRCLLTLACIAHPNWEIIPSKFDVAYAFMLAIEGMDLVRAKLLADIVYRSNDGKPHLSSFEQLKTETQLRITYLLGERYEVLRSWLAYQRGPSDEFDHFISSLFGEVLSQPGFGFHVNQDAGEVTAIFVESIQKFRAVAGRILLSKGISLGKEYYAMVQEGVISAQYLQKWTDPDVDSVLVAPAYTFLMSNRPVRIQFWLDVGSRGWSERLNQPLTHPYVLSRNWPDGRKWSDFEELSVSNYGLYVLIMGLLHRCKEKIYLGLSDLGEQGYETRGPLLQILQRVLLSVNSEKNSDIRSI